MTTVLVVDDDPSVRGVCEVALDGYTTLFAENGQEALNVLARQRVDAVVLDIMMPQMDGIEALHRIRSDPKLADTAVVLLTARVSEDDHLRGYHAGADAYLTKPFDPAALVAAIEDVRSRPMAARREFRDAEKARALLLHQLERRFE